MLLTYHNPHIEISNICEGLQRATLLGEWVGERCSWRGRQLSTCSQGGLIIIIHDMETKLITIIHYKVDVPVLSNKKCESALQKTRLGEDFLLHPVRLIMDGN